MKKLSLYLSAFLVAIVAQVLLLPANAGYKDIHDSEQLLAYQWALKNGITTMQTLQSARVEDKITRAELAKMISQYAISILEKKADTTKDCSAFSDSIASYNKEMKDYMVLSCQLGLMGLKGNEYVADDFRPDDYVTRADF
ncbi:hypothetical protein FACS189428_3590 [Clostridia bacterium]|nr:hypothetical protein FACS189428_3590 [Clostridia bacterium]